MQAVAVLGGEGLRGDVSIAREGCEEGGGKGGDAHEETLYMGIAQSKANLATCPSLSEHVAAKMRDEAAVAKERRKAREERAANK